MKILIVSHNCFSLSSNMGKTMSYYFSSFGKDNIAQLYFYSEIPDSDNVCNNYYRFTDFDAIKSILFRWRYGARIVSKNSREKRVDSKTKEKVYSIAKRKTAIKYFIRDFVWSLSSWNNKHLRVQYQRLRQIRGE